MIPQGVFQLLQGTLMIPQGILQLLWGIPLRDPPWRAVSKAALCQCLRLVDRAQVSAHGGSRPILPQCGAGSEHVRVSAAGIVHNTLLTAILRSHVLQIP